MANILTVSYNAQGKFCSINGIKINWVDTSFLKSRLDVCNCHGSAPGWIEHFPKLILRQCLCLSVEVPFSQIPLPQVFKLGKGGEVKCLYYVASMRGYSHDVNVHILHKVKEFHIVNVAFLGVHNKEMWSVQHSVGFQPPHKMGTLLMKFLFG